MLQCLVAGKDCGPAGGRLPLAATTGQPERSGAIFANVKNMLAPARPGALPWSLGRKDMPC